jgi:secreted trypsin-like serine protease
MKSTKSLIVVTLVLILVLGLAGIANAITFGEPDGNRHPNVGVMVVEWPDGSMVQFCSGSLIAKQVFLTAAHCTNYLATIGVPFDRVWVSFDSVVDQNATLYHGIYKTNPNYGHDAADPHDVAVVLLDDKITHIAPAQLPTAGLLDQMKDSGILKRQTFTAVGYGMVRDDKTGGWHSMADTNERRYVVQSFLALQPSWIQLSMNPSTGNGGTCYGDSGGPHFIGDTNVIAAITVTGDRYCRATDVDYRMDTESARSYLSNFVTVP